MEAMELEVSYRGLPNEAFKEIAMDALAVLDPKHFMKVSYRALVGWYIALDIAAFAVIVGWLVPLLLMEGPVPAWRLWTGSALLVALFVPSVYLARLVAAARGTWKGYRRTLTEAGTALVRLDDEGIHISREDGQKRIFLGWGSLTAGVKSKGFVLLFQGRQMVWILPRSCIRGRVPQFRALLEKHYYSRGLTLPEKKS